MQRLTSKLVENTAHSRIAYTCLELTQLEPNAFTDPYEILNVGSLAKDKLSFISNPIQDDGHLFQKVDLKTTLIVSIWTVGCAKCNFSIEKSIKFEKYLILWYAVGRAIKTLHYVLAYDQYLYTHDSPCMDVVQGLKQFNYPHDTRNNSTKNTFNILFPSLIYHFNLNFLTLTFNFLTLITLIYFTSVSSWQPLSIKCNRRS